MKIKEGADKTPEDCNRALSEKSRIILQAIAKGHTYEQILAQDPDRTYLDIFQAAAEALGTPQETSAVKSYVVKKIRLDHPRAYEKWSADEDEQLSVLYQMGKSVGEIANTLHRKKGAINSRLVKLKLVAPPETTTP